MYIQTLISLVTVLLAALPSLNGSAADSLCNSQRDEWYSVWKEYDVPCDVAESIVYPELIRYSIFQDKLEKAAVSMLYVKKGSEGCDYSIGRFQIKPSFAEDVEKRWMKSNLPQKYGLYFDTKETQMARKSRYARLENDEWQCIYIAVFLRMLYLDYGSCDNSGNIVQDGIETLSKKEQVRLAATAYNGGCTWSGTGSGSIYELRAKSKGKHFHTSFIPGPQTHYYVYGDIAVRHWTSIGKLSK